ATIGLYAGEPATIVIAHCTGGGRRVAVRNVLSEPVGVLHERRDEGAIAPRYALHRTAMRIGRGDPARAIRTEELGNPRAGGRLYRPIGAVEGRGLHVPPWRVWTRSRFRSALGVRYAPRYGGCPPSPIVAVHRLRRAIRNRHESPSQKIAVANE